MIDLDAIRARHLRPEQMEHRTFYAGHIVIDLADLCDEVERLRAENADLAAERLAALLDAERENTALRELLDAKSHEAGLYARRMEQAQRSRDDARAEERAAVVAWLNAEAERVDCGHIEDLADRIERGEHRREEEK
jgi:hypothetical protein